MNRKLVLICEDDDELREAIATGLSDANFDILTARNGEEGVSLALSHHPDLILMDILMPQVNGHEAVEQIRADEWGRKSKIIFLTALSDAENVVRAVEQGSDSFLVKDHTSLEDLVRKVQMSIHSPD